MTKLDDLMAAAPASVGALFYRRVAKSPKALAFTYPEGDGWAKLTWRQTRDQVDALAAGLLDLGLAPEDRVAIASNTRIEWVLADLAIACAGGAVTTVYPNSSPDEVAYVLSHSESHIVIVEDAVQLAKLQSIAELDAVVRHIVVMDDLGDAADDRVVTWAQLRARGKATLAAKPDCVKKAVDACTRDSLATLIYTSGTTGQPKGVELTHGTWVYQGLVFGIRKFFKPNKTMYLWLPLSHVFGNALLCAHLEIGFHMVVDGRVPKIVDGLGETHPHLMCGVPRIYEKVRNTVMTGAASGSVTGRVSRWAFAVGRKTRPYRLRHKPMPPLLHAQYALADRIVFSKLRERLGGNIDFLISGGAKLSPQVQEWFYSAGLLVIEGYGMTECVVPFVNHPKEPRFGTVGTPNPGTQVRIAADGELLIKGPGNMRGYHKDPELTAEVLSDDGWLATGDIGFLDADGFLTITDRKKDLMKTSGGKYVAPQKVESVVAANIPYVSQVVAIGDGRKYVSALLTLDHDSLMKWGKNHGHPDASYAELSQLPEIHASIEKLMARANAKLESWESVKKFAILDAEFSVEEGTATASMKVRRSIITDRFADVVESLYPHG